MEKLVEYICPRCGKNLIWTSINAKVRCNNCYRMIKAKDLKCIKEINVEYSNNYVEQLKIFK